MRRNFLEQRKQTLEKHSPAYNLLAGRITSNADTGVGNVPIDIKDLCGKIKANERDAFLTLIGERKETLKALRENKEVPESLRKSYGLTLEAISYMYKCLGVNETDQPEQSTE